MATKSRKVTTKMKKNSIRKQKCTDRTIQCFWGMRISSIVQNERCKTDVGKGISDDAQVG